ncbi:hypothetical protein GCM10009846_03610 [Agrococcus versicolor]|uniref:Uncharacterized protein n=1 Tax=Agrococcus versicolor TaxID=501482 RepID=A0ABN3AL42_9MICO
MPEADRQAVALDEGDAGVEHALPRDASGDAGSSPTFGWDRVSIRHALRIRSGPMEG